MPNLSDLADTEISLNDLDNIIEKESFNFSQESPNFSNQSVSPMDMTNSLVPKEDPFQKEMISILDNEINSSGVNDAPEPRVQNEIQPQVDYYENQNNYNQPDAYDVAFELIQEMDLLRLPQGIQSLTPEEIQFYKEQTLIQQREEALEYLRSQISHDPYMLEIFDYTMAGKDFADITTFKALNNVEINYETLNINDEETQKELVRQYLSSDLNPADKKDRELLS